MGLESANICRLTQRLAIIGGALALLIAAGCGTTRWSDTARTATEQLLISNAIDKSISEFDFTVLAGREVFFEPSYLKGVTDENYIVSSLRQHLLASGCILRESKDTAEFVVEARSGAVGTDRSDVLFGIPQVQVPTLPGMPLPSTIPELPLAKSTNQKAVAKLAVFVYNRDTGRPVMQTGVDPATVTAKNSWIFGAGPFQRGNVYEGTKFAGDQLDIPIIGGREDNGGLGVPKMAAVPVNEHAIFADGLLSQPKEEVVAQESTDESKADPQAQPKTEPKADDAESAARVVRLPQSQQPAAAATPLPTAPSAPASVPSAPASVPSAPASVPSPVQRAQYTEPASGVPKVLPESTPVSQTTTKERKKLFSGLGNLFKGNKAEAAGSGAQP